MRGCGKCKIKSKIIMQKEAKAKIKALIDKYELVVLAGKIGKYTEEETKNAFIKPLFEALGWDFSERDEVYRGIEL